MTRKEAAMKKILIASVMTLLAAPACATDFNVTVREGELVPAFNWTGLYVGMHGGYSWAESDSGYDNPLFAAFTGPLSMEPDGAFGGIHLGYNYHIRPDVVLGLEAAVGRGDINDTIPDVAGGGDETIKSNTDVVATLKGRVGYAIDRFLPYVTGGLAVAHNTVSATDGDLEDDAVQFGWTIGAGIEVAIDERWSFSVEYLYADMGKQRWFEDEVFSSTSDSTSDTIRVSLNARF
jgi:outer membrane immunogenic protein